MGNQSFGAGCVLAACLVLASCGGGGGGADASGAEGPSRTTFTPSSIQLVLTQGFEETIQERLSVSPEPVQEPGGSSFFGLLAADQPVVQTGQLFLGAFPDGVTIAVTTNRNLAPGTYEGQLTLHICRDSQCANKVSLTGNVLPYSIKVLPRLDLDVTGATAPDPLRQPNDFNVAPSTTVVVTSNIPVTWSRGSSITGTDLQVISSTPTRWEGTVEGGSGDFIGLMASSIEKPQNAAQVIFNIR